jgi:hypothetical protein
MNCIVAVGNRQYAAGLILKSHFLIPAFYLQKYIVYEKYSHHLCGHPALDSAIRLPA